MTLSISFFNAVFLDIVLVRLATELEREGVETFFILICELEEHSLKTWKKKKKRKDLIPDILKPQRKPLFVMKKKELGG